MYERPGRPHLCLAYNVPEMAAEFLSLAGIMLNAFIVANRWMAMPDQFSYFAGAQTHKIWILIFFSILPIGLYVALTALSGRLDRFFYPVVVDDRNAAVEYRLARDMLLSIKLELTWAASAALWCITGGAPGIYPALLLALLAIAVVATIAYYVRQMGRSG